MKTVRIFVPIEMMDATVRFYEDGLGLQEEQQTGAIRIFCVAGQQRIQLVPLPGPLLETRTNVRFHVHGIDECVRYLVSNGYLSRATASEPWSGGRHMDITDPAGNVITLVDAD